MCIRDRAEPVQATPRNTTAEGSQRSLFDVLKGLTTGDPSKVTSQFKMFDAYCPGLSENLEQHLPSMQQHAQHFVEQMEQEASRLQQRANQQPPMAEQAQGLINQFLEANQDVTEFMTMSMPTHKADGLKQHNDQKKGKKQKKAKKGKRHDMKFVADESLLDGSELLPNTKVSKEWRVRNTGSDSWPTNAQLQHVGSDLFEGTQPSGVPELQPGEETTLRLDNMIAPKDTGHYMSYWRLTSPDGHKFGDRLWFDVNVVQPPVESPVEQPSTEDDDAELAELADLCKEALNNLKLEEVAPKQLDPEEDLFEIVDLSASCMADIEASFEQLRKEQEAAQTALEEAQVHTAEAQAAAKAAAEAEAVAEADAQAEYRAQAQAAAEAAARAEAEAAAEAAVQAAEAAARAEAEAAEVAARAEAEAAEAAVEAQAAKDAEGASQQRVPVEWRPVVEALSNMGFGTIAEEIVMAAEGNMEAALDAALSYVPPPPSAPPASALIRVAPSNWNDAWNELLLELAEMGFEDTNANKQVLEETNGDLKLAVTALVSRERALRQ
eukprot:TRINITY_DN307_c0_g1_i4.p1 TRINITY_DN307_c0_g1~~TRINITY_DN307_c0_g1_i4.p1  ORF type:complete len:552 (-),score=252.01 TRINITY_DN307_c0_g1_i4:238-1893(-)